MKKFINSIAGASLLKASTLALFIILAGKMYGGRVFSSAPSSINLSPLCYYEISDGFWGGGGISGVSAYQYVVWAEDLSGNHLTLSDFYKFDVYIDGHLLSSSDCKNFSADYTYHSIKLHFSYLSTISCGWKPFIFKFAGYTGDPHLVCGRDPHGSINQTQFNVNIVNPVLTGTFDQCGSSSSQNIGLQIYGTQEPGSGTGSRTWQILDPTYWKIDGTQVVVEPSYDVTQVGYFQHSLVCSGGPSVSTLEISGDNMCATIDQTLTINNSPPTAPIHLAFNQYYSSCYYYPSCDADAITTSYLWSGTSSFTGADVTTGPHDDLDWYNGGTSNNTFYVEAKNACGTSPYSYITRDLALPSGCYWKKDNGQDSQLSYTAPYSVRVLDNAIKVSADEKMYPNALIIISNVLGQVVARQHIMGASEINLRDLPKGLYISEVVLNNQTVLKAKVLVH